MTHVVYAIIDPKTSRIYYVGRSGNFERRKRQHLSQRHGFAGHHTTQLTADGYFPLFFILETVRTIGQAKNAETYWIEACRSRGIALLNKENEDAEGPPMAGAPWTNSHDVRLVRLLKHGKSIPDIANALERTTGAIKSRIHYLKAKHK